MKTTALYSRNNLCFRDKDYSPAKGASLWETCPQLAALDPGCAFTFFDDFFQFQLLSADEKGWISTETEGGAGDAAFAIADAVGGVLSINNDAADNDAVNLQWNSENFKLASGKPLWYETRLKCSDATQSDIIAGLCITDTTLLAGMTDGVYFRKDDGDANLDFVTEKNSTETATAAAGTLSDDTFIKLGFFWDGSASVYAYINGALVATHTANIVDDEELAVSFVIQNGEAVAKVLSIDYVKVVQIR